MMRLQKADPGKTDHHISWLSPYQVHDMQYR